MRWCQYETSLRRRSRDVVRDPNLELKEDLCSEYKNMETTNCRGYLKPGAWLIDHCTYFQWQRPPWKRATCKRSPSSLSRREKEKQDEHHSSHFVDIKCLGCYKAFVIFSRARWQACLVCWLLHCPLQTCGRQRSAYRCSQEAAPRTPWIKIGRKPSQ